MSQSLNDPAALERWSEEFAGLGRTVVDCPLDPCPYCGTPIAEQPDADPKFAPVVFGAVVGFAVGFLIGFAFWLAF